MAIDRQQHIFTKGLNKDIDPRMVDGAYITDALNVEMVADSGGRLMSAEPIVASVLMDTIPNVPITNQTERLVCEFGTSKTYSFFFSIAGTTFSFSFAATTFANFQSGLVFQLATRGYASTVTQISGNIVTFSISNALPYELVFKINGVISRTDTVIDAFDTICEVRPLQSYEIQDKLFVLSKITNEANSANNGVELGVFTGGVENATYTRLLRTNKLFLDSAEVIDMHVSLLFGGVYSVNYVYKGEKPRVIYAPNGLTQDSCVTYINPQIKGEGIINLNSADIQTSLQLINNLGRINFSSQEQVGGALKSGGYRYFVRFGLNATGNVTEWSLGSGNVPVYVGANNKSNSWALIEGNPSGQQTNKQNILLVEGINPNAFDYIEVAAVEYAGTSGSDVVAQTAYIVGKKNVTKNSTTFVHNGNEVDSQDLAIGELLQVEDVYTSAVNQEIKKNRLNLASIETAVTDTTYEAFASGITINPNRFSVGNQGSIGSEDSNLQLNGSISRVQGGITDVYTSSAFTNIAGQYNTTTRTFTAAASGTYAVNVTVNWIVYPHGRSGIVVGGDDDANTFFNISKAGTLLINEDKVVQAFQDRNNFNSFQSGITVQLNAGQSIVFDTGIYNSPNGGETSVTFSISTLASQSLNSFNNTRVNGYMLPEFCANKVGYMINEVYCFYVRLHLKNGYITDPIFIARKQIEDSFATSATGGVMYQINDEVYNYNFIINSLNIAGIRDSVKGISFWRADTAPNVISTGLYCLADYASGDLYTAGFYPSMPQGRGDTLCYYNVVNNSNNIRKYGIFNSPEVSQNKQSFSTAQKLRSFGSLTPYGVSYYVNGTKYGNFVEYQSINMGNLVTTNVSDSEYVPFNKRSKTYLKTGTNDYKQISLAFEDYAGCQAESVAFSTADRVFDFEAVTKNADTGAYLAQIWANDVTTLLNTEDTNIYNYNLLYTGTFIEITTDTPNVLTNIQIFGGDTYLVKAIQKQAYSSQRLRNIGVTDSFLSSAIAYYTQSRINTDLNYNNTEAEYTTQTLKGFGNIVTYLQPYTTLGTPLFQEQFNNDGAYEAKNIINYPRPYDPNIPKASKLKSRIVYSEQRTEQGLYDFYRKILPTNFKDLDAKYGEIVGLKDVMDKMIAIQEDAISVLPYQTNVSTNADSTQVYIGTGGVYEQQQSIVATYGTTLKSAILVSKNNAGNNMLYWFDTVNKNFCRYSWDGIKILSVDNYMRTYFLDWGNLRSNFDIALGASYTKGSVYITKNGATPITMIWNERMNAFTSEASFAPLRYFNWDTYVLCPNITSEWGKVYNMFPRNTTETLAWFDGAQKGDFELEVSTNKNNVPKVFQSTSVLVGDGHNALYNPEMIVTTDSQTSTIGVNDWDLRAGTLYATVRNDASDNRIISNFAKFRVKLPYSTNAFIRILNIVNLFRVKYPNPFNYR